jgi:hypothetical protein
MVQQVNQKQGAELRSASQPRRDEPMTETLERGTTPLTGSKARSADDGKQTHTKSNEPQHTNKTRHDVE